ncbi:MAG TPA: family 20 glycosylhydrolase [Bryobacteraceae bacterium]|nr:family 20 glycosylhydrolase [Bryobacteraceae bacterium]
MTKYALFLAVLARLAAFGEVMPLPATMVSTPGKLTIDSSFTAFAKGYSDARLQSAISRFVARVSRQTGIPMHGAGKAVVSIECREGGSEYPKLGEDESYVLDVSAVGARLNAATVTGALRGLETLAQLIGTSSEIGSVHIEDKPRFPWRGLMLDVSRHFMPIEVVERNLDAMAAVKLNVFHWHLSDDQGFRVESKRFPKLHQMGSDGLFYTQAQIRQVVDYARDRGIRVVPEFDIPGHTTSWFVGYPELASAAGPYSIERKWGIFQPTMDPTREETYAFLDEFIGEMADLFPDSYFHIGGDEVEETQWKHSSAIQAFEKDHQLADSRALHAYFNLRLEQLLKKHGKTMIGWDEVLDPSLGRDTIIQSWRGQASLAEAARKGYRGILSFGYYLDHLKPAAAHYKVDPLADAPDLLTKAESSRILGGEACMWSEYVSEQTVDSRIWPRAAAVAERLWSRREVTDVDAMYLRLESVSRALDWIGVEHRSTYGRLLGRIAGRQSDALRVLADASEALGIEGRRDARHYTSEVPLNRFVDAVHPESESVRHLEQAARTISSPGALAELEMTLTAWSKNELRLEPPSELASLSRNLSVLGSIGLRALEYLKAGKTAPEGWVAQQMQVLKEIERPNAEVVLAGVRPVRLLVEGVSAKESNK